MITRRTTHTLQKYLQQFPAVVLLGPRQVGKTTLAKSLAKSCDSIYLDLEKQSDLVKLNDPVHFLSAYQDKLVVLDEVQRKPELFQELRGLIDTGKEQGFKAGRFLLLGSASIELIRQSGESLAGRAAYIELSPFDALEVASEQLEHLWIRGGFPDSFLAENDELSATWRDNFIRTYLERDIPNLGPRIPAETLRRFWTMLAHQQGALLNAAQLARGLAVDGKTITRYVDLLVDLMLVRRLNPYTRNVGKRLVKSPKMYIRDSGIAHSLLDIRRRETLFAHPIMGMSWEAFAIENILEMASLRAIPSFYRTSAGAEIDLLLEYPNGDTWAIEVKRGLKATVEKGFYQACRDLNPSRKIVLYQGQEDFPLSEGVEARSLVSVMEELRG